MDKDQVHIIGVSGGGYATLLAFMKLDYPVRSFNAWASISSLEDWYWECKGRGLKYAHDIELVTIGRKGVRCDGCPKTISTVDEVPTVETKGIIPSYICRNSRRIH